jgi:hypothetical protein
MKSLKFVILLFYMLASFWLTYLIFSYMFNVNDLALSADNSILESNFMVLLLGTVYSTIGISFMGVLALFTNFVFIKLLQHSEIKKTALEYLKRKRAKRDEIKKDE